MLMRRFGSFLPVVFIAATLFAQQVPDRNAPRYVFLMDPVCPVASFYAPPQPNATKEMRVTYYPGARDAKLKDPQTLTLLAGFNRASPSESTTVPMVKKDGYWEATVPLEKFHAMYAIFAVKDEKGSVDDNRGEFWDLVLCGPTGQKDVNGILAQARSFTGLAWMPELRRKKDYNRAIGVLKQQAAQVGFGGQFGLTEIWVFEAERDGDDAAAWSKVAAQIERYVQDESDARRAYVVGQFVVQHIDKFSRGFVDRIATELDEKPPAMPPRVQKQGPSVPLESWKSRVEYTRAVHEKDPQLRLKAYDAFVAKYPDTISVVFAQQGRFTTFIQQNDVPGAEEALAKYKDAYERFKDRLPSLNAVEGNLALARLYVDKGIKTDEALKLIDAYSKALDQPTDEKRGVHYPPEYIRYRKADCALLNARAHIALRKPELALEEARAADTVYANAGSKFVLAQALAAAGQKQQALDAYFLAAMLPSNKDLEYGAELQSYYLKQHFGNRRQFEAELERRKAERLQQAGYVPKVLDRDAPIVEFVSLSGERYDREALKNKTMVLNFWSPG